MRLLRLARQHGLYCGIGWQFAATRTVGADGRADGAIYYDLEGNECRQRAEIVIVACNGVGTPRLLLNSVSSQFPDGIANRNGLVGKNLMFHPYALVTGFFAEPLQGYKGPTGCSLICQEFYETDPTRGFVRGYSFEMLRGQGPVQTAMQALGAGMPWGPDHHAAYDTLWDKSAGMVIICEDLPEECNQVTLDPELKDGNGIPAPKITYRLSENSERMLEHAVARGKEALEAAGGDGVLAGRHVVITAGPTREALDPVRFITNHSSGRMGYALAGACVDAGASVTLVSGPTALDGDGSKRAANCAVSSQIPIVKTYLRTKVVYEGTFATSRSQ